ncbi:hypothetical protein MJO29_004999 [Puccinia striiformis f. sp. tritici]|nr:hypothetical protein Pst134EB_010184 [Puccinia striiformis f. sp. tritici]KAI7959931.1 hypothetical protein MJO29_004999 [Puccinia striiformis f. sp. tritici]
MENGQYFHFNPNINANISLFSTSPNDSYTFYALFQSRLTHQRNKFRPEIWTSSNSEPEWKAIPFVNDNSISDVWHATLQLEPSNRYAFTYRLKLIDGLDQEEQIIWLAKPGQDGQINTYNSYTLGSRLNHLLDACRSESSQHSITSIDENQSGKIQYHRFTLKQQEQQNTHHHPIDLSKLSDSNNVANYELLAFERSKPTWFTPRPLLNLSEISNSLDTQLLIIGDNDQLAIIVPLSTNNQSSTIRATPASPITICTEYSNHSSDDDRPVEIVVITGHSSHLRRMMKSLDRTSADQQSGELLRKPRGLGYCTWDSLGGEYKATDVLKMLDSFRDAGMMEAFDRVLLDDGWQDVSGRTLHGWGTKQTWLSDLEIVTPDSALKQPSSLAHAISAIRDRHGQKIKFVGVWMTITGYWDGLDPDSEVMIPFDLQKWSIRDPPLDHQSSSDPVRHWFLPSRSKLYSFWDSYFGYLKSSGADFVKIDNQAALDRLLFCETDPTEDAQIYKNTLMDIVDGLTRLHFGQQDEGVIHCMAHSPQIWFREASKSDDDKKKKKIMRTSDDFFPDLSDSNGHRWHVTSNAFTSMVAQGRGYIPDFDMTMSGHQWAGYHGCLRAFSSAPIYLTDRRGQHDLSIFRQLTAPLKADPSRRGVVQPIDGQAGAVLSSCALGQAALDLSSTATPWGLLKVGLSAPYASGALIGIWNVKQRNAAQNDDDLMAVDVLTARDIAETMLSTSEPCSGSSKNEGDDTQERKTCTEDLVLVNLHRPSKDRSSHSIIRRLELLSDFDLEAESIIPQRSSRPIVDTVLDSRPENGYEVWRVSSLVDLPDAAPNNCRIQVASLGLLDQFVGLCGVTRATSTDIDHSPPTQSSAKSEPTPNPPPRPSSLDMETVDGGSGKGLIDYISTILLSPSRATRKAFSKDRVKALFCQIARHPLRSLAVELGSLGKLVWSSILYLFLSPLSSIPPPPAPLVRDLEPLNVPSLTASIPSPSPPSNNVKSLRFECSFNGPIGFIIRLNHSPSNNLENDSKNQINYQDIRSVIRIKIDNQIIELPSPTPDEPHLHTKKRSSEGGVIDIRTLSLSKPSNPLNDTYLFLVQIHLHKLVNVGCSENLIPRQSSWTIGFERFISE